MFAIEATGIEKSFGKKKVLKGIDLKIRKGTIHAVLGPNGSGKTTLIRILSTLIKPDEGQIRVGEYNASQHPEKIREVISLTGQNASIDEELTGSENLYLFARLLGYSGGEARQRANELLSAFELSEAGNRLVKKYSGGMRRRLDLAASLVKVSDILFLDEPTTGLDPRGRNNLWTLIKHLARNGTTILLTTQYLEEAEQLADRITVIDEGRVISEGTSDELKASVGNNVLHVHLDGVDRALLEPVLESIGSTHIAQDTESKQLVFPVTGQQQAISILDTLHRGNMDIIGFNLSRPDLNEVFLSLTGNVAKPSDDSHENSGNEDEMTSVSVSRIMEHAHPYRHPGVFSNKFMFGWRNLIKIKHIPEQFMDALITPVMFTFMFTFIFGGAIAGSANKYLQFLIPRYPCPDFHIQCHVCRTEHKQRHLQGRI